MRGLLAGIILLVPGLALGVGGTAPDSFDFVTGARAGGMGGAMVANVRDATALQWNPAGLGEVRELSLVASSLSWVADINYQYASVAIPVPKMAMGFSAQFLDYGPFESTRGLADNKVSAYDLILTGGVGTKIMWFDAGVATKYCSQFYSDSQYNTVAMDAGLKYNGPQGLSVGGVLQNIGWTEYAHGNRPPVPFAVKMGAAWSPKEVMVSILSISDWLQDLVYIEPDQPLGFMLAFDCSPYRVGERFIFASGGEVRFAKRLYGRMGYNSWVSDAGLKAGLGGGVGVRIGRIQFDWAMGSVGRLGTGQYVTLSFGPAVTPGKGRPYQETTKARPAKREKKASNVPAIVVPEAPAEAVRVPPPAAIAVPQAPVEVVRIPPPAAIVIPESPADAVWIQPPPADKVPGDPAGAPPPSPSPQMENQADDDVLIPSPGIEAAAVYTAAVSAYNGGDYAGALTMASRVVKSEPENWGAWQVVGNSHYALGRKGFALAAYQRSLEINPGNSQLVEWVGKIKGQ